MSKGKKKNEMQVTVYTDGYPIKVTRTLKDDTVTYTIGFVKPQSLTWMSDDDRFYDGTWNMEKLEGFVMGLSIDY